MQLVANVVLQTGSIKRCTLAATISNALLGHMFWSRVRFCCYGERYAKRLFAALLAFYSLGSIGIFQRLYAVPERAL